MNSERNEINVQEIMDEIRQEISDHGFTNDQLSFTDVPVSDQEDSLVSDSATYSSQNFLNAAHQMHLTAKVELWHPLYGNSLLQFIKKVIRRLVRPVLLPVIEDQNSNNQASVSAILEVGSYLRENDKAIKQLREKIEQMEKRLAAIEKENEKLKNQLEK